MISAVDCFANQISLEFQVTFDLLGTGLIKLDAHGVLIDYENYRRMATFSET